MSHVSNLTRVHRQAHAYKNTTINTPYVTYAHMVNLQDNKCKHLIQFRISVDLEKVRNLVENFKCPTVLLKADKGVDVNLMNSNTFDKLIQDRTVLQMTSLRMEAYGNNMAVTVLGKFHAFLRWKGQVYRQLFYVTNANNHLICCPKMVVTL